MEARLKKVRNDIELMSKNILELQQQITKVAQEQLMLKGEERILKELIEKK